MAAAAPKFEDGDNGPLRPGGQRCNLSAPLGVVVQGSLEQPPVILRASRPRLAALAFIGLMCLAAGIFLLGHRSAFGLIFSGLGLYVLAAGVASVIAPPVMTIAPSGVSVKTGWNTRAYTWKQVANFRVVKVNKTAFIGFDRPETSGAAGVMRDLAAALRATRVSGTYDSLFVGRWSAPTDVVAALLNDAQAKWGGAVAARAPRHGHATGQRIDRLAYWLAAAVLLALGLGVSWITHGARGVSGGVTVLWVWVYARRLHDIGLSGWWQAPVLALQVAILLGLTLGAHWSMAATIGAAALLQLAFTAALGAVPGHPAENRFGPPPGALDRSALAEVFR
jgi:uncharacterized membrane protein YhaH (DUF805 family)